MQDQSGERIWKKVIWPGFDPDTSDHALRHSDKLSLLSANRLALNFPSAIVSNWHIQVCVQALCTRSRSSLPTNLLAKQEACMPWHLMWSITTIHDVSCNLKSDLLLKLPPLSTLCRNLNLPRGNLNQNSAILCIIVEQKLYSSAHHTLWLRSDWNPHVGPPLWNLSHKTLPRHIKTYLFPMGWHKNSFDQQ